MEIISRCYEKVVPIRYGLLSKGYADICLSYLRTIELTVCFRYVSLLISLITMFCSLFPIPALSMFFISNTCSIHVLYFQYLLYPCSFLIFLMISVPILIHTSYISQIIYKLKLYYLLFPIPAYSLYNWKSKKPHSFKISIFIALNSHFLLL